MDYLKLDPRIFEKPEFMRVNWFTRQVYLGLLMVSAKHDLHGVFSRSYSQAQWLIKEMEFDAHDSEDATSFIVTVSHLIDCSLLLPLGKEDPGWEIAHWHLWFQPKDPTAAARQGKRRAKLLAHVAQPNALDATVTHGTQHTQQNNTQHPPTPHEGGDADDGFDGEKLAQLWNEVAPRACPRVLQLAGRRETQANARASEAPLLPGMTKRAFWTHVIQGLGSIPFYMGGGDRGWVVTFDYLTREGNAAKVLESLASESNARHGGTREVGPGEDLYND